MRTTPPWRQVGVAALSGTALGALLLPWFTGWVPFRLDDPRFLLMPVVTIETWAGRGVAVFDGILLATTIAFARCPKPRLQGWLAASALLVMVSESLVRVVLPNPDLASRMRSLGPPEFAWSWLRFELMIPVVANAGVLLLGCRRPLRQARD